MKKIPVRTITVIAIMTALSVIFQFLEFSVPFAPGFLKFDFSDLPAFITGFAISPIAGVIVELLKNLIHWPMGSTGGVGELANFLVGAALVFPAGLVYKYNKSRKFAFVGSVVGTLTAAIVSFPINVFITYPFYENFMPREAIIAAYHAIFPFINDLPTALLVVNVPFTFIKGLLCVAVTFLIYKPLSPLIKGKNK